MRKLWHWLKHYRRDAQQHLRRRHLQREYSGRLVLNGNFTFTGGSTCICNGAVTIAERAPSPNANTLTGGPSLATFGITKAGYRRSHLTASSAHDRRTLGHRGTLIVGYGQYLYRQCHGRRHVGLADERAPTSDFGPARHLRGWHGHKTVTLTNGETSGPATYNTCPAARGKRLSLLSGPAAEHLSPAGVVFHSTTAGTARPDQYQLQGTTTLTRPGRICRAMRLPAMLRLRSGFGQCGTRLGDDRGWRRTGFHVGEYRDQFPVRLTSPNNASTAASLSRSTHGNLAGFFSSNCGGSFPTDHSGSSSTIGSTRGHADVQRRSTFALDQTL